MFYFITFSITLHCIRISIWHRNIQVGALRHTESLTQESKWFCLQLLLLNVTVKSEKERGALFSKKNWNLYAIIISTTFRLSLFIKLNLCTNQMSADTLKFQIFHLSPIKILQLSYFGVLRNTAVNISETCSTNLY